MANPASTYAANKQVTARSVKKRTLRYAALAAAGRKSLVAQTAADAVRKK